MAHLRWGGESPPQHASCNNQPHGAGGRRGTEAFSSCHASRCAIPNLMGMWRTPPRPIGLADRQKENYACNRRSVHAQTVLPCTRPRAWCQIHSRCRHWRPPARCCTIRTSTSLGSMEFHRRRKTTCCHDDSTEGGMRIFRAHTVLIEAVRGLQGR